MFIIGIDCLSVLKSVDGCFEQEAKSIFTHIKQPYKYQSDFFDVQKISVLSNTIIPEMTSGVYVFVINSKTPIKQSNFIAVNYSPQFNNSNHKRLGIKRGDDFKNGEILYLGKSEKKLKKRLEEHIGQPKGKNTYALRLGDKNRQLLYGKLDLYVFTLKNEYKKYSKTILSSVESFLHDIACPRMGTKRT